MQVAGRTLFKATAYIVGPDDGPGAALTDLARGLRFDAVLPFAGAALAEQQMARTPLLFFLFAAVDDVSTLKLNADAIRFCSRRLMRFSPLIYFSESPSPDAIRACAGMGFDDVLTLPFTRERVVDRLTRQLNRTFSFVETANYFGPDRRRQDEAQADERRGGADRVRRFEIARTISAGVSILKDARAA